MNTSMTKWVYLLCLVSAPVLAGDPIDETRAIAADAVVSIDLRNGSLTIRNWERPDFRVSGTLSDQASGFTLAERDGGLIFEEDYDVRCNGRGNNCGDGEGAELTIEVPSSVVLRMDGINVDVDVSGLTNNTEIALVNGEIFARELSGLVSLHTINGDIHATNLSGRLTLETVNGGIEDHNSTGSLIQFQTVNGPVRSNTNASRIRLDNVNGKIALDLNEVLSLEANTVGGDLDVRASLATAAFLELSSVHGRIELAVPASTSARFNLNTSVGGRIKNELTSDEPQRRDPFVNSSALRFALNGGEGDVSINTVSGNITLCSAAADGEPGC